MKWQNQFPRTEKPAKKQSLHIAKTKYVFRSNNNAFGLNEKHCCSSKIKPVEKEAVTLPLHKDRHSFDIQAHTYTCNISGKQHSVWFAGFGSGC